MISRTLLDEALLDDGAALRLAVTLRLHIDHSADDVTVWICSAAGAQPFTENGIGRFATRMAIFRAATVLMPNDV